MSFTAGIVVSVVTLNPFAIMPFAGLGALAGYLANQAIDFLRFIVYGKKTAQVVSQDDLNSLEGEIIEVPEQAESLILTAIQKLRDIQALSANPSVEPVAGL